VHEIPAVEVDDLSSPIRFAAGAEMAERGLRDIGFVFVHAPAVARQLPAAYRGFAEVLSRPEEELARYRRPEIHHLRGYTPVGAETAAACRGSGPTGGPQPDHRSCWLIGPEVVGDSTLRSRFPEFYAENVWPDDAPAFRERSIALHAELDAIGRTVLRALEPGLGYEDGFFDEVTRDGSTALRPLRYPPVAREQLDEVVWGCRHTDGNLVSVLPPSTSAGLKVKVRGGDWIDAIAPPDHCIVQVGDMLQYMTGGYLRSAVHRIDAPSQPTVERPVLRSAVHLPPRRRGPSPARAVGCEPAQVSVAHRRGLLHRTSAAPGAEPGPGAITRGLAV
jgi:isopenicillin N synthase-like dioxygenase